MEQPLAVNGENSRESAECRWRQLGSELDNSDNRNRSFFTGPKASTANQVGQAEPPNSALRNSASFDSSIFGHYGITTFLNC